MLFAIYSIDINAFIKRHWHGITFGVLLVLLLAKFLYPLFLFDVPLGYDPGIYRYLFLQYTESLQNLSMPELLPWAKEYPPGLFMLFAPLMVLGLPVDAIIGWIWNLVPVITLLVLAWVTAQRSNRSIGIAVLLIGLLSQAYFDGFFAMYYKTYVALLFTVLTYYLAERMSPWFLLTALLTVMTHQQTGLVLIIALAIWWIRMFPQKKKDHHYRALSLFLLIAAVIAFVWYLPQWERAIWSPLKSIFLLRGADAPAGSFPEATFYLQTMGIVLLLGLFGFLLSFKKEHGSLWQLSVLVCLIFILFRLVFYRRFFLQLDFFLMPFAAAALMWIWQYRNIMIRIILCILLIAQAAVSAQALSLRRPIIDRSHIDAIEQLPSVLSENSAVIALENVSGTWLRGWLPAYRIGAPGLFDLPGWSYDDWGMFIDGSNKDRKTLLLELEGPLYFYFSPIFSSFYEDRSLGILNDPCLERLEHQSLLRSLCSKE